jgi:hypothetical protein
MKAALGLRADFFAFLAAFFGAAFLAFFAAFFAIAQLFFVVVKMFEKTNPERLSGTGGKVDKKLLEKLIFA